MIEEDFKITLTNDYVWNYIACSIEFNLTIGDSMNQNGVEYLPQSNTKAKIYKFIILIYMARENNSHNRKACLWLVQRSSETNERTKKREIKTALLTFLSTSLLLVCKLTPGMFSICRILRTTIFPTAFWKDDTKSL